MRKLYSKLSARDTFSLECIALAMIAAVMMTTYSVFGVNFFRVLIFGILEILLSIPVFLLCNYTNKHRVVGGLICVFVYGGSTFLAMSLGVMGYIQVGTGFMEWLVTDVSEETSAPVYMFMLSVGGALLIGTAIYYFIVIRYRFAMLVLISLLPCVLYAKAIHDVNNGYLILLAGLNIAICVLRRRYDRKILNVRKPNEEPDRRGDFFGWATVLAFAVVVLIVCAAIPKQKDAKYYNLFEDTFLGGDTTSPVQGISSDLTEMSGNADGFNTGSNRRLYVIYGKDPVYIKTQHFDIYNFEKDYWTALPEWKEASYDVEEYLSLNEGLNIGRLNSAIAYVDTISPGFAEKYYPESLLGQKFAVTSLSLEITSLNFGASYYIVPESTVDIDPEDGTGTSVTPSGVFVRNEGRHDDDFTYKVTYSTTQTDMAEWAVGGGGAFTDEEIYEILTEMSEILEIELQSSDEKNLVRAYETVTAFLRQYELAMEYERDTRENTELISDEVAQLSAQITAGLTYDWEKAYALQEYFHNGEFKYDLNYRAPDDSVEYFLFTSKRGTCSDYATAYVLLARAAGLSARYTEGYVTESSGRRNMYYIKENKSHAFPEVYIQGTGWIIFEPTSGVVENSEANFFMELLSNMRMDYGLIGVIIIFAAIIGAIVFGVALLIPVISEMLFVSGLKSGRKNARDAYLRLIKKARHRRLRKKAAKSFGKSKLFGKDDAGTRAPKEVLEAFAQFDIDVSTLIDEVEKQAYREKCGEDYTITATYSMLADEYRNAAKIFKY